MQRYFAVDKDLNISDKDKHHIINVMRMKINDKIEIVYDEKVYLCEINDISKKDVSYSVKDIVDVNNELPVKVTIAVSLVNEKKLDFILQKCTELGIYDFILVSSDRSKIKIDGKENKVYINEPNIIPGSLAFYMFDKKTKNYTKLLDELITLAIKDYKNRSKKITSFDNNVLSTYNANGLKGSKKYKTQE